VFPVKLAEPDTSPVNVIVCAVCNFVAVAALPVQLPEEPLTLPVTLPVKLPVTLPVKLPVTLPVKLPLKVVAVIVLVLGFNVTPAAKLA
jgi:hypothetical protein